MKLLYDEPTGPEDCAIAEQLDKLIASADRPIVGIRMTLAELNELRMRRLAHLSFDNNFYTYRGIKIWAP